MNDGSRVTAHGRRGRALKSVMGLDTVVIEKKVMAGLSCLVTRLEDSGWDILHANRFCYERANIC